MPGVDMYADVFGWADKKANAEETRGFNVEIALVPPIHTEFRKTTVFSFGASILVCGNSGMHRTHCSTSTPKDSRHVMSSCIAAVMLKLLDEWNKPLPNNSSHLQIMSQSVDIDKSLLKLRLQVNAVSRQLRTRFMWVLCSWTVVASERHV